MDQLRVDADLAYNTSRTVGNDADGSFPMPKRWS